MKKFKYRLEPLLKAKEHIEKEKQKQHALALNQVFSQQRELSHLDQRQQGTFELQRQNMCGSLSMADMLVYARYILKLKRELLAGRELLRALERTERGKLDALLEASKERKIYEKLKEHRQEQFYRLVESLATKETDEAALNSFRLKARR
ncbi:MAG TPA: flagellar FliJ family protein [Candidatus Deferrimicrobium sp.]|nr:flagellar FliJ family protein [Candidatus Deferrimicrobium sp.]